MPKPSRFTLIAQALRSRATLARAIGDGAAGHLLTSYAGTIERERAAAIPRIVARMEDQMAVAAGDTVRAVLWSDALRDVQPSNVAALAAPIRRRLADLEAELEEARAEVARLCSTSGTVIDRLARQMLGDGRTWLDVARAVAAEHDVDVEAIAGRSRKGVVSAARQAFWTVLADEGIEIARIARVVGRDHTTVLYGVERVRAKRSKRRASA